MPETFGQRLRRARTARGLTQAKLSEIVGLHKNTIVQCELGLKDPSFFSCICYADALNVSLDWLAGRTDEADF